MVSFGTRTRKNSWKEKERENKKNVNTASRFEMVCAVLSRFLL